MRLCSIIEKRLRGNIMENYLDLKNEINYNKLEVPAEIIRNGGIVAFPTETVYGIGTNGLDEKAVKKLYDVKQRPMDKPISLLVSSMEMVEMVAKDISDVEYRLMEKFFPGPFTIILKKEDIVPDIVTANSEFVGVRMPSGDIARKLVELAGVPVATPSANISGKPSGIDFDDVLKDFRGKADFFIDGGKSSLRNSFYYC